MSGSASRFHTDWKSDGRQSHNEANQNLEEFVRQLARIAAQHDYELTQASSHHQSQQGTEE